ncbi:hypothetical protein DFJ63DRAFT_337270 [Scheffersomyces coipomensis]|uniref:uncharacterized protein n=1 Tax=Scheffersomyces coipomensis TaxID=1788519 RepID=UPI00315C62D4
MSGIQALISKFETNQSGFESATIAPVPKRVSRLFISPNPNISNYIQKSNVEEYPIKKSTAAILKDPQSKNLDQALGRSKKVASAEKFSTFDLRNNEPGISSKRTSKSSISSSAIDKETLTGFRILSPLPTRSKIFESNSAEAFKTSKPDNRLESEKKSSIDPVDSTDNVKTDTSNISAPRTESPSKESSKSLKSGSNQPVRHNVTLPLDSIDSPSLSQSQSPVSSIKELDRLSKEIDSYMKSPEMSSAELAIIKSQPVKMVTRSPIRSTKESDRDSPEMVNYEDLPDRSSKRNRIFEIPKKSEKRKSSSTTVGSSSLETNPTTLNNIITTNLISTPNASPHERDNDLFENSSRRFSTPMTPPIEIGTAKRTVINRPIPELSEGSNNNEPELEATQLLLSPIVFPNETSTPKKVGAKTVAEFENYDKEEVPSPNPNMKYITKIEQTLDNLQDESDLQKSKEDQNPTSKFNKKFGSLKKLFVKKSSITPPRMIVDSTPSSIKSPVQRQALESPLSTAADEDVFHDASDSGFDNSKLLIPNLNYQISDSPSSYIPTRPAPSPTRSKTKVTNRVGTIKRVEQVVVTKRTSKNPPPNKELPPLPVTPIGSKPTTLEPKMIAKNPTSSQQRQPLAQPPQQSSGSMKRMKRDSLFQREETIQAIEESYNKNRNSEVSSDEGYFRTPHTYRIFLSKVDNKITATSLNTKRNSIDVATQTGEEVTQSETPIGPKRQSLNRKSQVQTKTTVSGRSQTPIEPRVENQYWKQFMNQDNFINYFEKFVDESFTYIKPK